MEETESPIYFILCILIVKTEASLVIKSLMRSMVLGLVMIALVQEVFYPNWKTLYQPFQVEALLEQNQEKKWFSNAQSLANSQSALGAFCRRIRDRLDLLRSELLSLMDNR